jgi:hypothetical protein
MIVNWTAVGRIRQSWAYDVSGLDEVLNILESAVTRHDIDKSLTPPDYDITPGQLPVAYWVSSQGATMLGYAIAELHLSAEVTLYVP